MSRIQSQAIQRLNDALRQTFAGGRVMMTDGINALPGAVKAQVLSAVRAFSAFNKDNDPHGEHDFGSLTVAGERVFFKIDYYDKALDGGSENPADPSVTARVLTIMLASEY